MAGYELIFLIFSDIFWLETKQKKQFPSFKCNPCPGHPKGLKFKFKYNITQWTKLFVNTKIWILLQKGCCSPLLDSDIMAHFPSKAKDTKGRARHRFVYKIQEVCQSHSMKFWFLASLQKTTFIRHRNNYLIRKIYGV